MASTTVVIRTKEEKLDRLWRHSSIDKETNCWLWNANKTDGYGSISINGQMLLVHRLSASIFLGLHMNDSDTQANHKICCPNRNCWNPDHLYCGTQKENQDDVKTLGNQANKYTYATHCPNGHLYEEHAYTDRKGHRKCRLCARERYRKSDIKRGKIKQ